MKVAFRTYTLEEQRAMSAQGFREMVNAEGRSEASINEANPCKDGHALAMTPEGDDWCLREGCTFRTGAEAGQCSHGYIDGKAFCPFCKKGGGL